VPAPTAVFDHLVVAADTLDQGAAFIQNRLGVEPSGGGKHVIMGTHNRVLKLGRDRYLEVIAIDPDGRQPRFPRWFNLDHPALQNRLKIRPRLITWVVRTNAIDLLAERIYDQRVCVRHMQRDALQWRFALLQDGSMPGNGLIPHIIQWAGNRHPAESMAESGVTLAGFDGVHAEPESVQRVVALMGLDGCVCIRPVSGLRPPGLYAQIKTPAGMVVLD
jgi:hypothetical protein